MQHNFDKGAREVQGRGRRPEEDLPVEEDGRCERVCSGSGDSFSTGKEAGGIVQMSSMYNTYVTCRCGGRRLEERVGSRNIGQLPFSGHIY